MEVKNFYQQFCKEEFDERGVLSRFELNCPENFNFGYDVIDGLAALAPDKLALLWCNPEGEEHSFTYADLSRKSNQVANMLAAHGVKKGDKVLCVLKRHYQFWFVTMALCKLGAVLIPATNQLQVKDYIYRFQAAGVKYLIATASGDTPEHIEEAMKFYEGIQERFLVNGTREGWLSFDGEYPRFPETMERVSTCVEDDMLLYFTSGTTGYPKMVIHSYYYAAAHIPTAKYWHNLTPDSLHLTVSESGWGKCMWGKMYGQFLAGAAVFVYDFDRFSASELLEKIQKYRITSFCAPPTMYRFFIKEGIDQYDLSSLKHATIAGEALNPEVFRRFYEYTGLKLMEGYGQTETALVIATLPGMEPKPGSMGKPMPQYDVVIVGEDGQPVPDGEVGEIAIRTNGTEHKGLFKHYYQNTEETERSWHNGLYHTGDTGWVDEDGYIWYVGRTDDVIKSSGYRIGPFEIESVLMEHPAVLECAVTGAPDPIRGVVVKATIVLTKGCRDQAGETLAKELQDYVKRATAPYKYPRIVEFVEELPKTISGKIKRAEIRKNSPGMTETQGKA